MNFLIHCSTTIAYHVSMSVQTCDDARHSLKVYGATEGGKSPHERPAE